MTWCRTSIHHPSSLRGTGQRAAEGPAGGWLTAASFDAAAHQLFGADANVLVQTVETMGNNVAFVAPNGARLEGFDARVLFLGAGGRFSATSILGAMLADQRRRVVVVARPDALDDAFGALRLGAGDLLASPLSPQQISGAFERLAGPPPQRDVATGLPSYGEDTEPRFGQPCNLLYVKPGHSESVEMAAFLLRRFLRGYDRVGLHPSGCLELRVYCPPEHVPAVRARLRLVVTESSVIATSLEGLEPRAVEAVAPTAAASRRRPVPVRRSA
jgi:hypothetical protein